ncbi:MAG: sulfurtransferase-like selenium metabolism protein YedF [Lachnospiraceae bacterium]
MKTLNLLGQPCPIPIIEAKKELAKQETTGVSVLVDSMVAVQNLQKMADGMGYEFSYEEKTEDAGQIMYLAHLKKQGAHTQENKTQENHTPENTTDTDNQTGVTVLITGDQMGKGSEELGKILIKGFIFSLTELPTPPKEVIFLNAGIRLVTQGSNVIEDLQRLAGQGTTIYVCGTCLNYYDMTDKVEVGEVTNMFGITNCLANAVKLITL